MSSSFPGFGVAHRRHGCSGLRKLVRLAVSRGPAERSARVWRWRQAVVVRRRRSRTIPSRGKKFDLTDWRSSRIPTSGDFRRPLEGSSGPNLSRNSGGLSPRSWRAWCKTSWRLPKLLQTRFREARTALRWSTRWSKKASSRRKIGPRRPRWPKRPPRHPKRPPRSRPREPHKAKIAHFT